MATSPGGDWRREPPRDWRDLVALLPMFWYEDRPRAMAASIPTDGPKCSGVILFGPEPNGPPLERKGRRSPVRTKTCKTRRESGGPVKTGETLRCLNVGVKANVRNVTVGIPGRSCLLMMERVTWGGYNRGVSRGVSSVASGDIFRAGDPRGGSNMLFSDIQGYSGQRG
ncbi:hypothetical protein Taro_035149 [Colocasia esculenta]|uniref:Uncharacterized protein n=1 Tax=Colocasia esculenta TaxID=4460 RepID=A0A843VY92_COLES|nr:hypothetical protein [Colocasia esculenta]